MHMFVPDAAAVLHPAARAPVHQPNGSRGPRNAGSAPQARAATPAHRRAGGRSLHHQSGGRSLHHQSGVVVARPVVAAVLRRHG